jgi:hypothetical protein
VADKKSSSESLLGCVGILILYAAGTAVYYVYGWATDSQSWYAMRYSIPGEKVIRPAKPHDCEWSAAPLGEKNCHYRAMVSTIKSAMDQHGKAMTSYDDGKTWYMNDGSDFTDTPIPNNVKATSVSVAWERVQD